MDWRRSSPLRGAVNQLLENPFLDSGEARARVSARRVLEDRGHRALLTGALSGASAAHAGELVLAIACAQARESPDNPARVLASDTLAPRLRRQIPGGRAAHQRVALAAARCERALTALVGVSAAMRSLRAKVWSACFGASLRNGLHLVRVIRDQDVLVLGETGTGKELVARALQEGALSIDAGALPPHAVVNAAAVPESLLESELFGHVKGAFTGATENRQGRIRAADGGTFFLDEVGDLPPAMQVKMLRVMELDEVQPVGSDRPDELDVRFVAATHRDLPGMVARGQFRQDLLQRLAGLTVKVPPLRERPEDIAEIGMAFVHPFVSGTPVEGTLEEADRWLRSSAVADHAWPGNVRELQNALRTVLLGLQPPLGPGVEVPPVDRSGGRLPASFAHCEASLREVEDWYVRRVLAHTEGNLARASRVLGVDRSTVRRRTPRPA